jgi:hypothetical protein
MKPQGKRRHGDRNYGCEGNLKGRMAWGQKLWVLMKPQGKRWHGGLGVGEGTTLKRILEE